MASCSNFSFSLQLPHGVAWLARLVVATNSNSMRDEIIRFEAILQGWAWGWGREAWHWY